MERTAITIMAEEERRYDVLPPWAWPRPLGAIDRLERRIAAMERLIRENDLAFDDSLKRLKRLTARHRLNRREFESRLARDRAALAQITSGAGEPPS